MNARLLLAALLTLPLLAADWPQWRGPNRDGVSQEKGLLKDWPKEGPKLLWTYKAAGAGFSCPAVVGDRLYTMGARDADEYLICLDIKDPAAVKELWAVKTGPTFTFKGNIWGDGPRATPTVDGGLVYGLGGSGELVCVDADKGDLKWRKSMLKELRGQVNPIGGGAGLGKPDEPQLGWGYTWSPLVDGDKLICTPGGPQGTVAALDKKTGNVLWRSKDLTEQSCYASSILAEVGGIRHYVVQTYAGPFGVGQDGAVLWHYTQKYSDVLIPTPLFHDGHVYVTSGHDNVGCDLVKLTAAAGKITAAKVYANKSMTNRQGGVVLVGGSIYGHSNPSGWLCQDFLKGSIKWRDPGPGEGSITAADGCLYCFGDEYNADEGTVVLIDASPKEWNEKGRFALPEKSALLKKPTHKNSKRWTPPVIASGKLFLRDQDLIFCYAVK